MSDDKTSVEQTPSAQGGLRRVVGVPGAILMGLGSILGTGVFVSIGIGADIAGSAVVLAVLLAAMIATFNGLSSAQLAANHPVSGGTYEYANRYLNPWLGFTAGWMFLCAKSASAATAALGLAGYTVRLFGLAEWNDLQHTGLALLVVSLLTAVVAGGMRRSSRLNAVIVGVTLTVLGTLVFVGAREVDLWVVMHDAFVSGGRRVDPQDLLHATALMFVAYTGYGRIATLGEEIDEPRRSIPRAIIATLAISAFLYAAVVVVAVGTLGAEGLAEATLKGAAPLQAVAAGLGVAWLPTVLAVGAISAMAGVLLNLLLGISRVVLAMARRGDLPGALSLVDDKDGSPVRAVWFTGAIIFGLASIGSIKTTWTFSALTVLIYYGITNLAALRLSANERHFPRIISLLGLVSCIGVATFVDAQVWAVGMGGLALGLFGRWLFVLRGRASDAAKHE